MYSQAIQRNYLKTYFGHYPNKDMTAIHKPLSTFDIAKALHANSTDTGTLCSSGLISPWAKYKPLRRGVTVELTEQERAASHYGMKFPTTLSATAPYYLLSYYDGEMNGWDKLLPRGKGGGDYGEDEWYRILDFDGYEHNPILPVLNYNSAQSIILDSSPFTKFQVSDFIGGVDNSGASIELSDIATILNVGASGLYFGVALFKGTGLTPETAMSARTVIATSGNPITKTSGGIYTGTAVSLLPPASMVPTFDKGLWTVVPFFCVGQIAQSGAWTPGSSQVSKVFYPVPYASITEIDVQSYQDTYTVTFKGTKSLSIQGTVTIRNTGTVERTITLSAFYWDSSYEPGSTPLTRSRQSYERQFDKTVTLQPNSEYEWLLPSSADSRLLSKGEGYVVVSGEGTARGPYGFMKEK